MHKHINQQREHGKAILQFPKDSYQGSEDHHGQKHQANHDGTGITDEAGI